MSTWTLSELSFDASTVLNPNLAGGHAALGYALLHFAWDLRASERSMGEAIRVNPGYRVAHHRYSHLLPFQVVHAFLWWARGFLVFLILIKFLRRSLSVCYVVGALVVLHASDGALEWVGQMNQFGFIFWMLLAFYLLTLGIQAVDRDLAAIFVIAACFFEYMSLWSYESTAPAGIASVAALPLAAVAQAIGRLWSVVLRSGYLHCAGCYAL